MTKQAELASFKKLLEQKIEVLRTIYALTTQQPALIQSEENTDALLENIQKRQILLDKLEEIQGEVPDMALVRGDPECSAMAAQVQSLLSDIQKQDRLNEETALNRMDQLREQLKKARDGKTVLRGYEGSQTGIGATYFDKIK